VSERISEPGHFSGGGHDSTRAIGSVIPERVWLVRLIHLARFDAEFANELVRMWHCLHQLGSDVLGIREALMRVKFLAIGKRVYRHREKGFKASEKILSHVLETPHLFRSWR
jgi:hypothetical protein